MIHLSQGSPWTTHMELTFLERLGDYAPKGRPRIAPRRILLKKYLDTMHLRYDWGAIDYGEVRRYIIQQLKGDQDG